VSGDVVTWSAVAVGIGAVISIVTFWTRYSDRLTAAKAKADEAIKAAEEAKQATLVATAKADALSAKLYQVEIWARDEFVRKSSFETVVARVERGFADLKTEISSRLDKMSDKIDHMGPRP
jgi:hypothetical protein